MRMPEMKLPIFQYEIDGNSYSLMLEDVQSWSFPTYDFRSGIVAFPQLYFHFKEKTQAG